MAAQRGAAVSRAASDRAEDTRRLRSAAASVEQECVRACGATPRRAARPEDADALHRSTLLHQRRIGAGHRARARYLARARRPALSRAFRCEPARARHFVARMVSCGISAAGGHEMTTEPQSHQSNIDGNQEYEAALDTLFSQSG